MRQMTSLLCCTIPSPLFYAQNAGSECTNCPLSPSCSHLFSQRFDALPETKLTSHVTLQNETSLVQCSEPSEYSVILTASAKKRRFQRVHRERSLFPVPYPCPLSLCEPGCHPRTCLNLAGDHKGVELRRGPRACYSCDHCWSKYELDSGGAVILFPDGTQMRVFECWRMND